MALAGGNGAKFREFKGFGEFMGFREFREFRKYCPGGGEPGFRGWKFKVFIGFREFRKYGPGGGDRGEIQGIQWIQGVQEIWPWRGGTGLQGTEFVCPSLREPLSFF